jgi:energy-coupling factor transport system permease protein
MLIAWRYRPQDSWVHRLDPRVKIVTLFVTVLVAAQVNDVRLMACVFALAFFYYFGARIPWREIRGIWLLFSIFVILIVSVNALVFTGGGGGRADLNRTILLSWPWIRLDWTFPIVHPATYHLTAVETMFVVTQAMRFYSIAAVALTFPFVIDPVDYGVAFRGLGVPYKFAFALDMAFRYVPAMARDLQTTIDAQRVRGYELDRLRGGALAKSMRLGPIVVPVVLNTIIGAEDIVDAMDLRCFGIGPRTWLRELRFATVDKLVLGILVLILVGVTLADLTGHTGTWYPPGWS